jgi:uncharacterized protein involved in exopolysaccharide biosynthesis
MSNPQKWLIYFLAAVLGVWMGTVLALAGVAL